MTRGARRPISQQKKDKERHKHKLLNKKDYKVFCLSLKAVHTNLAKICSFLMSLHFQIIFHFSSPGKEFISTLFKPNSFTKSRYSFEFW